VQSNKGKRWQFAVVPEGVNAAFGPLGELGNGGEGRA